MPWTYREVDQHRCDKPGYDSTVRMYDRWKCDECGIEWIVVHAGVDQREGGWLNWQNYENWQSGPFAPGTK